MPAELSPGALRLIRRLRTALALTFVSYALVNASMLYDYSMYYRGNAWTIASAAGFLVLALALYAPWTWLRVGAVYLGGFLLLQALATPLVRDLDYITLEPNLVEVIDVQGTGMPGIHGIQQITTDAKGFRVTAPVDYSRPEPLRIFTIGGSTTEEIHHDDRATWSALLEAQLTRDLGRSVRVINTGVSGLRSPNHLATLEHISAYHPDAVIVLLGANDWNCHVWRGVGFADQWTQLPVWLLDAHRKLRAISLRESLVGDFLRRISRGTLHKRNDRPSSIEHPKIEVGDYYTRQNNSLARPRTVSFRPIAVDPLYAAYLERIVASCERHRIQCILVTQPNGYRQSTSEAYRRSFWMTPPNADYTLDLESLEALAALYNEHLVALGRVRRVPVCDVAPQIEASFAFFYDDLHFNLAGARRMSEVLAPCVATALRSVATIP